MARPVPRARCVDQWEQNRRRLDYSLSQRDRDIAGRRRNEAETQLRLLRNEDSDDRNLTADFNPYRYLASEGFLPGYSFPRLPIAAYIPPDRRLRADGDFVQRARFLAIREFGPRALIYHEGNRYEVNRVQLPPDAAGELVTHQAHRCPGCGYYYDVGPGNDRCQTRADRAHPADVRPVPAAHRLHPASCSGSPPTRRNAAAPASGSSPPTASRTTATGQAASTRSSPTRQARAVARLAYGDSAEVHRINLGPVRRPEGEADGFWLDPVTGALADRPAGRSARRAAGQRRRRRRRHPGPAAHAGHPLRARPPQHPRLPARRPRHDRHRAVGHVRA